MKTDFKVGDKVRYSRARLAQAPYADPLLQTLVGTVTELQPMQRLTVPLFVVVDFGGLPAAPGRSRLSILDARMLEVVDGQ